MSDNIETIARDLQESLKLIKTEPDFGWLREAVQRRRAISLCTRAMEAARGGDKQEATRIVEIVTAEQKALPTGEELHTEFRETACWLWTQRRFAVNYRHGWFDATGVMIELNTNAAEYCEETERKPSADWYRRTGADLWFTQSHLFHLVYHFETDFRKEITDMITFMLYRSPAREHHQAKLQATCPAVHELLFPDSNGQGDKLQ